MPRAYRCVRPRPRRYRLPACALVLERGNVLVRLADVRARAEILDVRGECRGCAGAHGLGPGVIVRLLARLFLERSNVLVRLADVRAGAEVLEIRGECGGRSGAQGVGPGLLVRRIDGLRISRGRRWSRALLRLGWLAASRHEPSGDDAGNRQSRDDEPSGPAVEREPAHPSGRADRVHDVSPSAARRDGHVHAKALDELSRTR